MLNSLSLFSGYAGIDLALSEYCRPILYREKDLYAQGIILSRMDEGLIPFAPIWNDVTTLDGTKLRGMVDIISGGFPCQDISSAGKGAGLAGERSGLFYEIVRLTKEIRPTFVFLENVPAIRTRGLEQVVKEFTEMGYDCRWTMLSAASTGAPHKRERWFFLAHSHGELIWEQPGWRKWKDGEGSPITGDNGAKEFMANANSTGRMRPDSSQSEKWRDNTEPTRSSNHADTASPGLERQHWCKQENSESPEYFRKEWWETEPDVGRVVNGGSFRVDRIKALGNGVVPLQVKIAFEKLIGKELTHHLYNISSLDL